MAALPLLPGVGGRRGAARGGGARREVAGRTRGALEARRDVVRRLFGLLGAQAPRWRAVRDPRSRASAFAWQTNPGSPRGPPQSAALRMQLLRRVRPARMPLITSY